MHFSAHSLCGAFITVHVNDEEKIVNQINKQNDKRLAIRYSSQLSLSIVITAEMSKTMKTTTDIYILYADICINRHV